MFAHYLALALRSLRRSPVAASMNVLTLALGLGSFSKPVLIASLVAWPLAYLAAGAYLNQSVNPIDLSPLPFVACLVFTVLIAWLAVGGQTWRAAREAPANVLRSE